MSTLTAIVTAYRDSMTDGCHWDRGEFRTRGSFSTDVQQKRPRRGVDAWVTRGNGHCLTLRLMPLVDTRVASPP
jgi:hypothetical protein